MFKFLVFLIVFLCSCSKYEGDRESIAYDTVTVIFDGYGEYETEGQIVISITDSVQVKKLNKLKNLSQTKWLANVKGTEYLLRLVFKDSKTEEQLLISISKSINSVPVIEYGTGTIFDRKYKNDKLVDYIGLIIKLSDIKQHGGSLSQEEYDQFIFNSPTPDAARILSCG